MKFQKRLVVSAMFFLMNLAIAETHTVRITKNMSFEPVALDIEVGDTVSFVNDSQKVHTVTADSSLEKIPGDVILPAGATPFHSGSIAPGSVFSHTFDVEGDYQYVCLPHELMGMKGNIRVLPQVSE